MANRVPDSSICDKRVTVHGIRPDRSVIFGTGFCSISPDGRIEVHSVTGQQHSLIVNQKIADMYTIKKHSGDKIGWNEVDFQSETTLSFEDSENCAQIWKSIKSIMTNALEHQLSQLEIRLKIDNTGNVLNQNASPMYHPSHMRTLLYLTNKERIMYGQGLKSLWDKMSGSPTNSPDQITARQGIIRLSVLLTKMLYQRRNLARQQGQTQEQQSNAAFPSEAREQRTASNVISTRAFEEPPKGLSALSNILNAKLYLSSNSEIKENRRSGLGISETGQPLETTLSTLDIVRCIEEMQLEMLIDPNLSSTDVHDVQQILAPIDSLKNKTDGNTRMARASSEPGGDKFHNSMADNVTMAADKSAKSRTAHEATTQKVLSNCGADAEQPEALTSATDSGYASQPTHDYKEPNQNTEMNGNKQIHSNGSDIDHTSLLDNENQPMDDTGSVYTAGPNISPSKTDAYISSLADDLLNKAFKEIPDEESLDRICKALPRHLKTFAMKMGSSDSALICREVSVFVRKYRNKIAHSMRKNYVMENNIHSDVLRNKTAGMDFGDLVSNWDLDADFFQDPNTVLNNKPDDVMEDIYHDNLEESDRATDSLPEISAYKDFISKHPAYVWLLQSIRIELYMGTPGNIQTDIREKILGHLPRAQSISRREAPSRYVLTFTADWDPVTFLQEQKYKDSPERAVERAITFTGSKIDAQAVTTAQYLKQTWPSSGIHLLHVVKHVVRDDDSIPFSCSLPDSTQLVVWSRGPEFKLEVAGTADSIAEIGEQLAWLGSALRSSPHETSIAVVGAFVSGIGTNPDSERTEGQAQTFFCNIGFNADVIGNIDEAPNGQCWHQLFRNPVIVAGYPIPRRPMDNIGLEIHLDTLASLVGTRKISTFDGRFYIKGFSIILVPTWYSHNILLWHLICKKNGDYVSYVDGEDVHAADVSLSDLKTSRHILGWSSQARHLVGSADANYNINRSWLRGLDENCKLDGISISRNVPIQSNHEAAAGEKETLPWNPRASYRKRLDLLSQKYMVLWDAGCKRGWLVNGVNALLHLLRTSLEINKTDNFSFAFRFKSDMFEEACRPYTVSAAMEVLTNSANLDIELYEEEERDESGAKIKFRVCDRVNDLFETLEKAIGHQIKMAGAKGEKLKFAPRKDLEGWDFKDIATEVDPIYPRLAKLKTAGKGWVDFIRAIGAVCLFGNDFGNLIDPVAENPTCSHWELLPEKKYYLAASVEDLNTIMDNMGRPKANPPLLTNSLVWHPYHTALDTRCDYSTLAPTHCERAQVIWPSRMSRPCPTCPSSCPLLEGSGAVVFGHNVDMGWIWNDFGDPKKGQLPLMDEESDDDNSADSGIGPSLRSTTIAEPQHVGQTIRSLRHEHYKVAIICALPKESMAVRALFDETHQDLPQHASDANRYALGSLGTYNIVVACLPSGRYGTNAAAKVASDVEKSFPALKWYLVVGIGGGIPSREHDIRLGDVVVGNGVIQHDMGRIMQQVPQIMSTGVLQRPDKTLLTAMSWVQSDPSLAHDALEAHIQRIVSVRPEYQSPGEDRDTLFHATSKHEDGQETCEDCKGPLVPKKPRLPGPHIHYGVIASGNQVIKDAVTRDCIGAETKALCVEMEGAGVMETGNCLVIRGICDYADSHKNDDWHKYAAATAAAYAKLFLLRNPDLDMEAREAVQKQKRPVSSVGEETHGITLAKRPRYH